MENTKVNALIDSHCHLDFDDFDRDREQVIEACLNKDIHKILIPGVSPSHWGKQINLCKRHDALVLALGIHPYFLEGVELTSLEHLDALLSRYKEQVVAVGEIGIDGFIAKQATGANIDVQQAFFVEQLRLAQLHALPIIIHHRQSHNQIIRMLKALKFKQGGVIHAFSGSKQEAMSYIDLGFLLGVGGTITYERAVKTRQTIQEIPLDYLLLETDSPDMPLHGFQEKRNSPDRIVNVAQQLALLKGVSIDQLSEQTDKNFYRLFSNAK